LMMAYCWILHFRSKGMNSMASYNGFIANFISTVYGDDFIYTFFDCKFVVSF